MYYRLFDTLLDAAIVINEEEKVIYCNQAAADMINSSVKRVTVGKKFSDLFKLTTPAYTNLKEIQSATPYKELTLIGAETDKVIQLTIQPDEGVSANHQAWIIFIRDLTLETRLQQKYSTEQKEKKIFKQAAEKDGLTGIFNKKSFWEKFRVEVEESIRYKNPLSLLFFDIDNFKKLNDTHGHPAGDFILSESVKIIESRLLRSKDIFGRYGGEEFAIVLHKCRLDDAMNVAERIRKTIQDHNFVFQGKTLKITLSIGVGQWGNQYKDVEEFLQKVDEASYVSKTMGKNQVSKTKYE